MSAYLKLIIVVSMLVAACGSTTGDDVAAESTSTTAPAVATTTTAAPETTTTAAPTTTTSTSTTTVPPCEASELASALGEQNAAGRQLPPGCYFTEVFSARISFTTTMPMDVIAFPHSLAFGPQGVEIEQLDVVLFAEFLGALPPDEIGTHPPHDPPVPPDLPPMPDDLGEWFENAAQIVILDAGTEEVSGGLASWWDVTVDPSLGDTFSCPYGNCIAAPFTPGGNFVIGDGETNFRIYQLEGAGDGLYLWVQWTDEAESSVFHILDALIASMTIS